jgi:hypothetical protein
MLASCRHKETKRECGYWRIAECEEIERTETERVHAIVMQVSRRKNDMQPVVTMRFFT